MKFALALSAAVIFSGTLLAHPMGNFSVNHYARLEPGARGLILTYVLDLAELPTTELIQSWGVDRDAPLSAMEAQANAQARQWAANLHVTEDAKPLLGVLESSQLVSEQGAAGLPIYRISARIRYRAKGGRIEYEDGNYATRAGWREIVIRPADGGVLKSASSGPDDRSQALTSYPKDQQSAPPQESNASLVWEPAAVSNSAIQRPATPVAQPVAVAPPVAGDPAVSPPAPDTGAIDTSRANRTAGAVLGVAAFLLLARRFSRSRYSV